MNDSSAKPPRYQSTVPIRHISVMNKSARVADADVELMVRAIQVQLNAHVQAWWGPVPLLEFVRPGTFVGHESFPCYLLGAADVPNADGYHEWNVGKVFIDSILDNGGTVLEGSNSVSACLGHEVLEAVGDGPTNIWCDGPKGLDYARELCDAVESQSYVVDVQGKSVSVSNFVLPDFFNAHAKGMFDFLGHLRAPFSMAKDGYQITRTEPGSEHQIWGALHADAETREIGPHRHIHFGPDFPAWKKDLKATKAHHKRGKRT